MSYDPVLSVRDLCVTYGTEVAQAVANLSFDIARGEALALVGESGCGKSTTAHAIMRLLPDNASFGGRIVFTGTDIIPLAEKKMETLRGNRIGMIFQEPMSSLNPVYRIGAQIAEAISHHQRLDRTTLRNRVLELLDLVQLPDPKSIINAYPHQLSGGQRQRVMIAMAVSCAPDLLIADEPTTALDATVQAHILELLDGLRRDLSMSLLLISHDLAVVSRWTDRVVVMHHGEKIETLGAKRLFNDAQSTYTLGLQEASLRLDEGKHYRSRELTEIRSVRTAGGQYRFELTPPKTVARPAPSADKLLLSVENITVDYNSRHNRKLRAVDDVSFTVAKAETVGLVGESGSGKSTLGRVIMQLTKNDMGSIIFDGKNLTAMSERHLRPLRRDFQMVFQDPYSSLNPRRAVSDILETTLIVHGETNSAKRQQKIRDILDKVGMPASTAGKYPHEFSGGQRQRIAIARALILRPKLIVCDEPVSALDVSIQAQVLNLLCELKQEFDLSYIFISHDLAVVRYMSDRVMVMKSGRIVETGDHETIWRDAAHDYTRELIAASA